MKCPLCGKADSQQLLTTFLCTNITCKYYDDKWDYEVSWGSGKELLSKQREAEEKTEEASSEVLLTNGSSLATYYQGDSLSIGYHTDSIAIGTNAVCTNENSFVMGSNNYALTPARTFAQGYVTSGLVYQDEKSELEARLLSLETQVAEMAKTIDELLGRD